jgi:hypothetical protein
MLMVYHSVVLERPPLPLQPFAQTVTLHVRLFPVQWHLKVPEYAQGCAAGEEKCVFRIEYQFGRLIRALASG